MSDEQNKRIAEPELTRKKHVPLKEYGLLKTMEWPDGTVISLNTRKGEENLRIYHSSGTYHEFTSEGTQVSFASNNSVNYSKGGMTVTYDHSGDTKAAGHMRVSFDHDAHVEFKKNASIVLGSGGEIASLGHLKLAAKGNLYLGSGQGKVVINGGKGVEIKGEKGRVMVEAGAGVLYLHAKKGDVHIEAKEDVNQHAGGDIVDKADGHHKTLAGSDITENAKGNVVSKAGGNVGHEAGGAVSNKASGGVYLEGSSVNAKSGSNKADPQEWVAGAGSAPTYGSGEGTSTS